MGKQIKNLSNRMPFDFTWQNLTQQVIFDQNPPLSVTDRDWFITSL